MSAVEVRGLHKSYGRLHVLDDLDLLVPSGSLTAVLGASGCGKTTLLRAIAGFVRADAGEILVGGQHVAGPGVHVRAQRREIGYVPQEGALFPHLTVAGNVLFGVPRVRRSRRRLLELLELAELPAPVAARYPHELSGGQQQRAALARALAPGPSVILLDEPFSSLDTSLRVSAGRTVARVLQAAGATALLVTHDQGEALSLADRVAVMRSGRVVQVGSPGQVYDDPADPEVAHLVGGASVVDGTVAESSSEGSAVVATELGRLPLRHQVPAGPAQVVVRPEQLEVVAPHLGTIAEVADVDYYGAQVVVHLRLRSGAAVAARGPTTRPPVPGETVGVVVVGSVRAHPPRLRRSHSSERPGGT